MTMDIKTFAAHIGEALESLENELSYAGPYSDMVELDDDVMTIPFDDGSKFRLVIERTA